MEIRPATTDDIPAMHRIRLAVRENVLTDPSRIQPADYAALLRGPGRGFVALVDGRVVGFGIANAASRNLWALFVDPAFEGRGIGRRLHDELLDWLFGLGSAPAWLTTEPGSRAERFYRVAGWQDAGRDAGKDPGGDLRLEFHPFDDEA
ncbi:MAG: GNAT family N-acetyltransferase [Gammaproteobacteria bacterium]|nr:GNAT family N-acetyltransferase [Gammaproteobacteria bacterium]